MSGVDLIQLLTIQGPVPAADCSSCMYQALRHPVTDHCYMFHQKPPGPQCGQFTQRAKR